LASSVVRLKEAGFSLRSGQLERRARQERALCEDKWGRSEDRNQLYSKKTAVREKNGLRVTRDVRGQDLDDTLVRLASRSKKGASALRKG